MSRSERGRPMPRAMIHRRILDVAASDPDASITAIADEVSGASPELVERVLDEYGDPGTGADPDEQEVQSMNSNGANPTSDSVEQPTAEPDDQPASGSAEQSASEHEEHPANDVTEQSTNDVTEQSTNDADGRPGTEAVEPPSGVSLSEKQRRTLRALYERPDAAQGDIAEELDVTRATVSRRLNSIPGFEWTERRAFVDAFFDGESADDESHSPDGDDSATPADGGDVDEPVEQDAPGDAAVVEELRSALTDVERRLSALEADGTETNRAEAGGVETDGDESAVAESSVDEPADGADAAAADLPPELAHKVVHACMESDRLTEDEELAVLRSFMGD